MAEKLSAQRLLACALDVWSITTPLRNSYSQGTEK